MKSLFSLFIVFILFSNCSEYSTTETKNIFNQAKELANKNMLAHFPDFNTENILEISYLKPQKYYTNYGYFLTCSQNIPNNYSSTFKKLNKESKKIIKLSDSCLIITDKLGKGEGSYEKECLENTLPIPDKREWWGFFGADKNYIPNDIVFFVIDAKSGVFLPENLLTDGSGMPDKWRNGYSKGFAISKESNIILYWLIIW